MKDLDESFEMMEQLLHAVWPAIKEIDWSDYCTKNHKPEPGEDPWYKGLMLYGSDGKEWVRYTTAGSITNPDQSLVAVRNKANALHAYPYAVDTLQLRNPEKEVWAGGSIDQYRQGVKWCITELPDLGDHLLLIPMLVRCGRLQKERLSLERDSEDFHVRIARDFLGMSNAQYDSLRRLMADIVQDA